MSRRGACTHETSSWARHPQAGLFDNRSQDGTPMALARERMTRTGQWRGNQLLGRRWAIGCVALEVTQRCNLDCTLCYLSDMSEAGHDLPPEEIPPPVDPLAHHH